TITDLIVGGSVGRWVAEVEDAGRCGSTGSGAISGGTIGGVGSTGSISGGSVTGVTVTHDMAGTVKAQGAGTITDLNVGGSLTGSGRKGGGEGRGGRSGVGGGSGGASRGGGR